MEDTHVAEHYEHGSLFAICDGHGGAQCALFVAAKLREDASKLLRAVADAEDTRAVLVKYFLATDAAFALQRPADRSGSTCALVLAEAVTSRVTVAHIGDSRVVCGLLETGDVIDHGGSDGALTSDHSPGRADERARIEQAGSWVSAHSGVCRVEGVLAVSRAFGDLDYKTASGRPSSAVVAVPEVSSTAWGPHLILLLCCDGVTEGNFTSSDASRVASSELRRASDAAAAARAVCKEAFAAGSMDNISCIVVASAKTEKADLPAEEMEEAPPRLLRDMTYRKAHEAFSRRASPGAVLLSAACAPDSAKLVPPRLSARDGR
jgi:serine/threonine protein phosphatase PrpC